MSLNEILLAYSSGVEFPGCLRIGPINEAHSLIELLLSASGGQLMQFSNERIS